MRKIDLFFKRSACVFGCCYSVKKKQLCLHFNFFIWFIRKYEKKLFSIIVKIHSKPFSYKNSVEIMKKVRIMLYKFAFLFN